MSDLVEAHLLHLRAGGYATRTLRARASVLGLVDRVVPHGVEHAAEDELEAFLAGPTGADEWAAWTRYTYFEHLLGFYRWAVERGELDWNPMERLIRPPQPDLERPAATEEQVAIGMTLSRPWRTAVILAAFAGMRAAEIARARLADVGQDVIAVVRKGGREQLLPTHKAVWAEVWDLSPGLLVRTPRGRQFSPAYLSAATSQALTAAGLDEVTLHLYRRWFAATLLRSKEDGGVGMDIRTVQDLMGHASVRATQMYVPVTDRQRRRAIAALPVPALP